MKQKPRPRQTSSRAPDRVGTAASKGARQSMHHAIGNRAAQKLFALQAKSRQGGAADHHEQSADRVAEDVTNSPKARPGTCGCQGPGPAGGTCQTCGKQKAAARSLEWAGAPLEPELRGEMEGHLHHDLSEVRIHTGGEAADTAEALDARAYTVGPDIVFGAGEFSPATREGRGLLAHELTHVVQQSGAGDATGGDVPALQRKPKSETYDEKHPGATLPYQQAVNLGDCVRIMGPENQEYCQREVLGEDVADAPLNVRAGRVATDLASLISGAAWKEIRKRAYPRESAAGVARAKKRKLGQLPDLTGLGSISRLESFATGMDGVKRVWGGLNPDERVQKLGDVAGNELDVVDVPRFMFVDKFKTNAKAAFRPMFWQFLISDKLVTSPTLSNKDAGEVANATYHESRHAEQSFLAARFSAARNNSADLIKSQLGIPKSIAEKAVAKKFTATTAQEVEALGRRMFNAKVLHGTSNQAISDDDGHAEMEVRKVAAEAALAAMRARPNDANYQGAVRARNALREQIAEVERKYSLYRAIPYEADAHEVGDAAEEAFKMWP